MRDIRSPLFSYSARQMNGAGSFGSRLLLASRHHPRLKVKAKAKTEPTTQTM